jgi:hypothetical protein
VVLIYVVRLVWLWIFKRKAVFPLLYVAPRGLITILLFFQISGSYPEFIVPEFNQGILLFVILSTSIVMTISLIQNGLRNKSKTSDLLKETEQTDKNVLSDSKETDSNSPNDGENPSELI